MREFIGKQIKEVGLGIAAFCLMSWMVVTITTNMVASIDTLSLKMIAFTHKVQYEHQIQIEAQKELMTQHRAITAALGRINGYTH